MLIVFNNLDTAKFDIREVDIYFTQGLLTIHVERPDEWFEYVWTDIACIIPT